MRWLSRMKVLAMQAWEPEFNSWNHMQLEGEYQLHKVSYDLHMCSVVSRPPSQDIK